MDAKMTYLPDGKVELVFPNGSVYRGEISGDRLNGQGSMEYVDGRTYEGRFVNDEWDGWGKATFESNHSEYEGSWSHNKREGRGTQTFFSEDGSVISRHEAEFRNDVIDGQMKTTWGDGTVLVGVAKGYDLVGPGRITYGPGFVEEELRGWTYEGPLPVENDAYRRVGPGTLTDPSGVVYEGAFEDEQLTGPVTITYPDGTTEQAQFAAGRRVDAPVREEEENFTGFVPEEDDDRFLRPAVREDPGYAAELAPYFDGVIGMDPVKSQLDRMYKRFKIDGMRRAAIGTGAGEQGYYFIITGNPGTGKSTIARIIGRMLHDLGLLTGEAYIETDRSKLVGQYIGQTAIQTAEIIGSARGGTLFVDEAYTLFKKGDEKDFGQEAIDTLLKDMEDHRGQYCVILAGYRDRMEDMMRNANPGLSSRFDHKIHIEDYTAEELTDILVTMAGKKHFFVEKEARPVILDRIRREKVDDTFDNARFARRLLDEAIERQALRLTERMEDLMPEDLQILTAGDFGEAGEDLSDLDATLAELNGLIGLDAVKEEVNDFVRAVKIRQESRKRGLPIADNPLSLNMVFTGNPGTGKTTVARLLSRIYYHLDLLKRPDVFVECTRADLVGRYQGETAIKVRDVVRRALGGILFIDEAYSLINDDRDSFGIEAVNTLVSEIENHREELAVILAGYEKEMEEFLDSNPGLRSRLPRVVLFADYDTEQLMQIFRRELTRRGYEAEVTEPVLRALIERKSAGKDFGNARGVRNLCDDVIEQHNRRMNEQDLSELSNDDLLSITDEDAVIS